ncbi:MAG: hypothetical protein U9O96_07175 [Candidatus Thermoplasmatota archaeon]|nr:hypothetical protein [Candidatus Thermoplasmatota archaeon]
MQEILSLPSKQLREELGKSEEKYQQLREKRDELNRMAKVLREERDLLNQEKKKLLEEMKSVKKMRDDIVKEMRKHKEKRTEYQSQGKSLIQAKRKQKNAYKGNVFLQAKELKIEIRKLEYEQETVPMKPKEEERIIREIKEKRKEYAASMKEVEKQKKVEVDLTDLDKSIDELFKMADGEHEMVVKYYQESQQYHEKYVKLIDEVSKLIKESNEKHNEYIETKQKADEIHQKAVQMLGKVIAIKNERKSRYKKAKDMIKEQNVKARKLLEGKDKIIDKNIEELKKKGKITIGV